MNMCRPLSLLVLLVLLLIAWSSSAPAANKACAGISKKCTTDTTYDKTIGGKAYSCYDCKQTLCKNDGNGGIAGTSTSSVCTEKARTFQPLSTGDQSGGRDRMAPKSRPRIRPGSEQRPRKTEASRTAAPEPAPTRHRKPVRSAPESNGARGDSASKPRETPASDTLSFDEADALFGRRTKAQSMSPATPTAATAPRIKPVPTPPGIPIPYPTLSE